MNEKNQPSYQVNFYNGNPTYREVRYMCPKVRLSKSILDQENEKMSTLALLSILGDFWF